MATFDISKELTVTSEISPQGHTWVSTRGDTMQRYAAIYKNVSRKKAFRMPLQDYIKTMMLDFINKRSSILILKLLKWFYWLINSKIVTASLLLNLYRCY